MSISDCFNQNSHRYYFLAVDAFQKQAWNSAMEHIDSCVSKCTGIEERGRALLLKGMIAGEINCDSEATACFEQAAQILPGPMSYLALSSALIRSGEFARAANEARAGLALLSEKDMPLETSALLNNLGDALVKTEHYDEAAKAYRKVLRLTPDNFAACNNLGIILQHLNQIDAAIEQFKHAVRLNPDVAENRLYLSHVLCLAGRYEEAWPHYEYRWGDGVLRSGRRLISKPALAIQRWEGAFEERNDQQLLVLAEQGLGDTLQFCRYLPMVLERFTKVGFVCPKPLHRLLVDSIGTRQSNLVFFDEVPKEFWEWDSYIPLLSLPMAFRTDLENIPATIPYLSAHSRATQRFASRLERLKSQSLPRIGLVWAGGHSDMDVDQLRSIPPAQLDPLIDWLDACWVSLQKPESDEKRLKPHQRAKVVDWMDEMKDFADTAALIASLDLVISVDTSVAHLAAAMGKPVWLLNRLDGCWRWLHNRDDSPWYPTMRIFTQKERGNWNEVLARVLSNLKRRDFRHVTGATRIETPVKRG